MADRAADMEAPMLEGKAAEPLLFGRFRVQPKTVLNFFLMVYTVFFVVYRVADMFYLMSLDARFPKGLEYFYPNKDERQQSVAYTQQTLTVTFLQRTVNYFVVVMLVLTGAVARVDDALRSGLSKIGSYGGEGGVPRVVGKCLGGALTWFAKPCWLRCCCGWMPNWGRAFRGAIYLSIFATLFLAVSMPFKFWHFDINVQFGFVNTLTVTPAMYRQALWSQLTGSLTGNLLQFFLYLLVLQSRFGWFLMWFGLIAMAVVAQYNMGMLAPMLFNAKNLFPNTEFGVARGFPLVQSGSQLFSLNRLFFADEALHGHYVTNDQSKGAFSLGTTAQRPGEMGHWVLASGITGKQYAKAGRDTTFLDSIHDLEHLERQSWKIDSPVEGTTDEEPRIGVRDGAALRTELFDFAKHEGVGIGDIYLIDGSHADARANAFVAGAGKDRVIGLYDTLFLGDRANQQQDESSLEVSQRPPSSADGGVPIQLLSESLQRVDTSEEEEQPVYHKAQTQAMSDKEVLAILAHELGHAKMHDVEQNMVVQALTSFATWATLGWMVQSPVLAMALGVFQPIGHVACFAFDYIVGPSLDHTIKFLTDGITRQKEYVADAYAAGVSEDYATGLQTSLAKLTVSSNQDPDEPWYYEMLHADHPTFANRFFGIEEVKKELYEGKRKVKFNRLKDSLNRLERDDKP